MVVFKLKYNSNFYCLATLDVEIKDEKITLNNEQGPLLKKLNNE